MKKAINIFVIIITVIFIGVNYIVSFIPNITLTTLATLACFAIPVLLSLIVMIVQIKIEKSQDERDRIRIFWLKELFIIYCLLLIYILFFSNEYRYTYNFQNVKLLSKEHFEMSNIVPFRTILRYISKLKNNMINTSIVILNLIVNIVLLAPMGFFIPILFKHKIKGMKQFIFIILIIILILEFIQFVTWTGFFDIDDVILNVLGAVIFYLLMKTKVAKSVLYKLLYYK